MPIDFAHTEEIKQAIRDEPRRRMDEAPGKRATEQDLHPNAATSSSTQQEGEEEEADEEQSNKRPRLNDEEVVAEEETKVAEEDEDSEPSSDEDDDWGMKSSKFQYQSILFLLVWISFVRDQISLCFYVCTQPLFTLPHNDQ